MANSVIVISGPTASGKTKLGVALAKEVGGEIISADSMQLYKYMDIGTAKPTEEEQGGIPHHMLDVVTPFEDYSVSRYVEDASKIADEIIARGKLPIIVGGTGLYIDALINGSTFAGNGTDCGIRERISMEYDAAGGEAMLERLRLIDPESGEKLHPNDKKRIVRALEVVEQTGKTISAYNEQNRNLEPKYTAVKIALSFADRQDLYDRINLRVDLMMEKGLEAEVRSLLEMGIDKRCTALQAIGYKEIVDAIEGKMTISDAAEFIKQQSRRYAKRQLSWLRRYEDVNWIIWEKEPNFKEGLHSSTNFIRSAGLL